MKSDREAQGPTALAVVAISMAISVIATGRMYRNMAPSFREPRTTIGELRIIPVATSIASMVASLLFRW